MSGFTPLELQILSINVLGLASSTLNWSWLKWDQQLKKISNFSVSQSNEINLEDIDWFKTILSWIVVARFIINRISFLAYVANIYTLVTRSRQNLLVLWMVLSFFKDIILEVVVIVITFLLWRKGIVLTSFLVEFIAEKTICLVVSICKWCTTYKWYAQLRRITKIRRFTIIARRSIANIVTIPGRVGHSLDDECLGIAIIRRGKYASLLNLDRLSEELSSRANTKSLTTLTEDTNGTNDYNSDVNDLSVAEKSMRMLNVTAEDVMDARARIQERSYWEQDEIAKTPEDRKKIEEAVAQFPLEKNKEEIDALRNKQKDVLGKIVDHALRKEDIIRHPSVKKEEEKDNEIILVEEKDQILTRNQEEILIKSNDVTSDKWMDNHAKSTESHDTNMVPKKKRKEEEEGVAKIVQYPSFQSKNARNMEAKPCTSLVRKLEAKLCSIPVNQKEKWIDRVDRKRHPCQINTQLTPLTSVSKKERSETSKISCTCHRAMRNTSKNGRHARSIGIDGKNVEYDINGKKFIFSIPIINIQRSKLDKSAFKYSEAYRLKKQIQKWEESHRKQSWGSKSLAQTAHPSGYAKTVDASKLSIVNCRRNIQTRDESMMMSDSLSERYRLKHERSRRSVDLRSDYDVASFKEKNYTEAHEIRMKVLETCNNLTLKNKGNTKTRKRHDLLPASRKLSIEEREGMELRTLRAYNELTLSEDKKELEVRKEHDSSLNYEQLTRESEVSEIKISKTYNNPTSSEEKAGRMERGHNLSPSFQRSVGEQSASSVRNELLQVGSERELRAERKRDLSRDETPLECEEDVETPASVSNRLSIGSYYENVTIPIHRSDANRNSGPNDRCARQAHTSLNLKEITRNIQCTVHPRGIILTNKNLYGQFLENGRLGESQQRDIVDDNIASTLHSAFFFRPEIITRVFRRTQAGIGESFPSFPTFRGEGFDTEFVCQMNNEMVVCNRDSTFDLERMVGNNRNTLADSVLSNANDNRGGERGHDVRIIFFGQEPSESETVIDNSTTVESQENARSSIESTRTNILIFDEDCNSATNDNLPIRLITDVGLRNFDIEMSGVRDVASPNEEHEESVSNVNVYNNPQSRDSNTDINLDKKNNNDYDKISLYNNANIDDTIHEIEQTLNTSDNCLDNVNVTPHVSSLGKLNNSRDEKYLSTIDIHSENEICENNNLPLNSTYNNTILQLSDNNNNNNNNKLDMLDKNEKSMFNRVSKNPSKLSIPGPSSFESDNCHALKSCDEELKKLSDSTATLNEKKRKESISNLKSTNCDTLPQFRNVETLNLETATTQGGMNENREVYDEANKFLAEKIFKMHSDDNLQQDDSFYFMYERDNDPGTPVSLEDGSLMEEFLNDPIPFTSSYS